MASSVDPAGPVPKSLVFEDFFAYYPTIRDTSTPFDEPFDTFPPGPQSFEKGLKQKKEFHELRWDAKPKDGYFQNHQTLLARLLSDKTLLDSIAIIHDMGTGKTSTAIATIEGILESQNSSIRKALVLVRNKDAAKSFRYELVEKATKKKYMPDGYYQLSEKTRTTRVGVRISPFYEINTHESFANEIATWSDNAIISTYSNRVIVIDEVQFVRWTEGAKKTKDEKKYTTIHRFLHLLKNCKIIIMSGTPMRDQPEEIIDIANLILSSSEQLPPDFDLSQIGKALRGKVSYLKYPQSFVKKSFQGKKISEVEKSVKVAPKVHPKGSSVKGIEKMIPPGSENFIIAPVEMEAHQLTGYRRSIGGDEDSLHRKAQQASAFVYPDGSFGEEGYKKYKVKISSKPLEDALKRSTPEATLAEIQKCSAKYHAVIKYLLQNPTHNSFIYNEIVAGSGCVALGRLLELFGYVRLNHKIGFSNLQPAKRYVIIASEMEMTENHRYNIKELFNSRENCDGQFLQVIIGSRMIATAVNLFNVRHMAVVTPFWNYTDIDQAIARVFRYEAHNALLDKYQTRNLEVKVFQYCAMPPQGVFNIDLTLYQVSLYKDREIKAVGRLLKQAAIDCSLNYSNNFKGEDNSRECDYQQCQYICEGFATVEEVLQVPTVLDELTYKLYYTEEEEKTLIPLIKEAFQVRFSYSFQSLIEKFRQYTPHIILLTLKKMIDTSEPMTNRYNFVNYLKERDDIYFLTDTLLPSYSFTDVYYVMFPQVSSFAELSHLTQKYAHRYSGSLFEQIQELHPTRYDALLPALLKRLPKEAIQQGLELAIANPQGNTSFREWFLRSYRAFVKQLRQPSGEEIQLVMYNPPYRCLRQGSSHWEICTPDELSMAYEAKENTRRSLENSTFGFYGIFNPNIAKFDQAFWIRFVAVTKLVIGKGYSNKKSRVGGGRICKFFKKPILAVLGWRIGVLGSGRGSDGYSEERTLHYFKELASDITPEDQKVLFDPSKLSANDIDRLHALNRFTKPELCRLIYERLRQLEKETGDSLIMETTVTGKQEQVYG